MGDNRPELTPEIMDTMTSLSATSNESSEGLAWCFQCGSEYDADVAECVECGVPTTSDRPTEATDVGDEEDDQLAYELHQWTGQGRSVLDGMLTRSNVAHAWQGATLIVREDDEDAVDEAIAATEIVAMPTLDLNEETMAYELDDLTDEQHGRLLRRLGDAGISHAFDRDGDLHVYEADEDRVDEVFETLDAPDPSERQFGPGISQDPLSVISDLFVAVGRVRKRPTDAKGRVKVVETTRLVEQMRLPYGMSGDVWAEVVDRSTELSDQLDGSNDEQLNEEELMEMAGELHARLRLMI